jgi:mono/diheme cytochrome c family protein
MVFVLFVMVAQCASARASEEPGAELFKQYCSPCHQADGAGIPGIAPALKGPHWSKLLRDRSYLPRVVAFGLAGPIRVGDATYNSAMPPQAHLTDEQLAAVINFVAVELNAAQVPDRWRRFEASGVAAVRASQHGSNEQRQLRKQILAP